MICFFLLAAFVSVSSAAFGSKDKQDILDAHNSLRSQIAKGSFKAKGKWMPYGSDLMKIKWSPKLEQSAQAWADRCVFQHSSGNYGENLYTSWSSNVLRIEGNGRKASDAWANEFQQFGWKDVKMTPAAFSSGIGHATQMAWASTSQIGCGASLCDGSKKVIVVCQYEKPGNYMNQNIYTPGRTCEKCPNGTKCETSTGLCA